LATLRARTLDVYDRRGRRERVTRIVRPFGRRLTLTVDVRGRVLGEDDRRRVAETLREMAALLEERAA